MILLTKIDGSQIGVNADEIETIETNYDTSISLRSGKKIIVKDNFNEIYLKTIEYRANIIVKAEEIGKK